MRPTQDAPVPAGGPVTSRFTSPLRSTWIAAWLGIALGVAFTVCFATGMFSYVMQHPPSWFVPLARPAGLYRLTQGLHVATGIAAIPLLLAKLWVVYPGFWKWPPVDGAPKLVERLALMPLVGGSLFLLLSGVNNIALWYPWAFFFPTAHRWAAWITIGALVVHVGAKIHAVRAAIGRDAEEAPTPEPGSLSRRGLLTTVAAASGLLTLVTVGQTLRPLERLALLAPRRPSVGPQGFPVNKTAIEARVVDTASDPGWALVVEGAVDRPLRLSLDDLRALPLREAVLPIACVEGWSASVRWRGVPLGDVLRMAGAADGASVAVESLQKSGLSSRSEVDTRQAADPDTLIALECNGEPLDLDHGYPARLIGPNRPGTLQTKWLARLVVA